MPLCLALLLAVQAPSLKIQLNAKVGDSFFVRMTRAFEDKEDEFDFESVEHLTLKCIERDDQKLTFGIVRRLESQKMDGQSLTQDPKAEPVILRDIRLSNGVLFWTKPVGIDAETEARLWRLTSVAFPEEPVRVGSVWTYESASLQDLKLPGWKAKFRLVEFQEGTKKALIWIDGEESGVAKPIKVAGRALVDSATGWPTEMFLEAKNAPLPGGDGKGMQLKLSWKLL